MSVRGACFLFGRAGRIPAQSSMFGSGIAWRERVCLGLDSAKEERSPPGAPGAGMEGGSGFARRWHWENWAKEGGEWPMVGAVAGSHVSCQQFPAGGTGSGSERDGGRLGRMAVGPSPARRHSTLLGQKIRNGRGGPAPRVLATRSAGPFVAGGVRVLSLSITRTHISPYLAPVRHPPTGTALPPSCVQSPHHPQPPGVPSHVRHGLPRPRPSPPH